MQRIRIQPWQSIVQRTRGARRLGGFTLLESLMAAALMSMVVLAVASGITTAQQVSYEGQKRILASMVADDLMLELSTVPYLFMQDYNGLSQSLGEMESLDGQVYPKTFRALGRQSFRLVGLPYISRNLAFEITDHSVYRPGRLLHYVV